MSDYVVPLLLLAASLLALRKKENAYDLLLQGGAEGLRLLLTIAPALVILLTAVQMLSYFRTWVWLNFSKSVQATLKDTPQLRCQLELSQVLNFSMT